MCGVLRKFFWCIILLSWNKFIKTKKQTEIQTSRFRSVCSCTQTERSTKTGTSRTNLSGMCNIGLYTCWLMVLTLLYTRGKTKSTRNGNCPSCPSSWVRAGHNLPLHVLVAHNPFGAHDTEWEMFLLSDHADIVWRSKELTGSWCSGEPQETLILTACRRKHGNTSHIRTEQHCSTCSKCTRRRRGRQGSHTR